MLEQRRIVSHTNVSSEGSDDPVLAFYAVLVFNAVGYR